MDKYINEKYVLLEGLNGSPLEKKLTISSQHPEA